MLIVQYHIVSQEIKSASSFDGRDGRGSNDGRRNPEDFIHNHTRADLMPAMAQLKTATNLLAVIPRQNLFIEGLFCNHRKHCEPLGFDAVLCQAC